MLHEKLPVWLFQTVSCSLQPIETFHISLLIYLVLCWWSCLQSQKRSSSFHSIPRPTELCCMFCDCPVRGSWGNDVSTTITESRSLLWKAIFDLVSFSLVLFTASRHTKLSMPSSSQILPVQFPLTGTLSPDFSLSALLYPSSPSLNITSSERPFLAVTG